MYFIRRNKSEPKQTYFEEHDVQVLDAPVDCTVDGVIFNWDNPEIQKVSDVKWEQLDCYSELAEEEGYQLVHMEIQRSAQAYYDSSNDLEYNYFQGRSGVYDWYTGRYLRGTYTMDGDVYEYTGSIDIDGNALDISYTHSTIGDSGEWTAVPDGSGDEYCDIVAYETYTFKVPEGYDGLVLGVVPERNYEELNIEEFNAETSDASERCVFDEVDGQHIPEDTVFYRINKEGLTPLRQSEE